MERRYPVLQACCRVFRQHILFQTRLELDLAAFQQRQPVVKRVVDVHIIAHNVALDTPFLPSISRPLSQAQVLACQMRARGVVLAPFPRLVGIRRAV